jgi:hypothetical protein
METPFASAGFKPDAVFTGAAERFFELLKSFGAPTPSAAAGDWSSLAGTLAGQFEQWLKASQSAGPWFAGASFPGAATAFAAAPPASTFGPLPLGPAAAQQPEAQRTWELLAKLGQLQAQLAAHWRQIANTAAQSFIARLGAAAGQFPTLDNALKLYEQWVNCAEEAYAATVRKEEFCRLQSELGNVSAALLVEQRRHAETLVRAFGMPTRAEVDALYAQLKDLRQRLSELGGAPRARTARPREERKRRPAAGGAARRTGKRAKSGRGARGPRA